MKKYQILLMLLITILYISWNYYSYESSRKSRQAFLSDFNISVTDMQKCLSREFIETDVNYTFWDLEKSEALLNREKKMALLSKKKNNAKSKERELDLKKRVICLGKECWEFLGIVEINNRAEVALLSKDKKLQTFKVGDILLKNIRIIKIRGDELLLEEIKKRKRFSLKLFEVDSTKYLPKESIKGKND